MRIKKCKVCEMYFKPLPTSGGAVAFCSNECRQKKQKINISRRLPINKHISILINCTCIECGEKFQQKPKLNRTAYCSQPCRTRRIRRESYIRKDRECLQCRTVIEHRANKFCSPECQSKFNIANPKQRPKECEGCGVTFNARSKKTKYCSNECKSKWAHKRALAAAGPVHCLTCNNEFIPTPDTYLQFCSDDCKLFAKQASWSASAAKRRAVIYSIPFTERVNTAEIFARDGGICQSCGIKTSKAGGKYHKDYPTIDHIIPISKGGGHIAANLQCMCLRCNIKKSDKIEVA